MAAYANVKTKVFIHFANTNTEASDVGTMARDVNDYVTSLDSTTNKVISITHTQLNGDRILTMVVSGA